jgi:hypothetical protein
MILLFFRLPANLNPVSEVKDRIPGDDQQDKNIKI